MQYKRSVILFIFLATLPLGAAPFTAHFTGPYDPANWYVSGGGAAWGVVWTPTSATLWCDAVPNNPTAGCGVTIQIPSAAGTDGYLDFYTSRAGSTGGSAWFFFNTDGGSIGDSHFYWPLDPATSPTEITFLINAESGRSVLIISASVPEPSTGLLLCAVLPALYLWRRKRSVS